MTQINWSLGQGNSFQNALAQGFQIGSQIKQQREQTAQRNALAEYARNPSEGGLNALADFAPEFVLQERARMQQGQAQAQQRGYEGIAQFRPVLEQVQANPALWGQARQTAIQSGIDASRIPEQYDPAWVQGQLLFAQSAEDGSLPTIARELQVAGIDVATLEGQQVLRQVIEGRYATEYTDDQGNVRRQSLFNLPPVGGPQQAPVNPGGDLPAQGVMTMDMMRGAINGLGPEGALAWLERGGRIVQVTTPDEARSLPSGTRILLPDGTEGRVP